MRRNDDATRDINKTMNCTKTKNKKNVETILRSRSRSHSENKRAGVVPKTNYHRVIPPYFSPRPVCGGYHKPTHISHSIAAPPRASQQNSTDLPHRSTPHTLASLLPLATSYCSGSSLSPRGSDRTKPNGNARCTACSSTSRGGIWLLALPVGSRCTKHGCSAKASVCVWYSRGRPGGCFGPPRAELALYTQRQLLDRRKAEEGQDVGYTPLRHPQFNQTISFLVLTGVTIEVYRFLAIWFSERRGPLTQNRRKQLIFFCIILVVYIPRPWDFYPVAVYDLQSQFYWERR